MEESYRLFFKGRMQQVLDELASRFRSHRYAVRPNRFVTVSDGVAAGMTMSPLLVQVGTIVFFSGSALVDRKRPYIFAIHNSDLPDSEARTTGWILHNWKRVRYLRVSTMDTVVYESDDFESNFP